MSPKPIDADIEQALSDAIKAVKPTEQLAWAIVKKLGLTAFNDKLKWRTKSWERYEEKLEKYGGDSKRIRDTVGFTVLYNDPSQILELRELLGSPQKLSRFLRDWPKVMDMGADDMFLEPKPHGYVGYHLQFRTTVPNHRTVGCEIKMLHVGMQVTDQVSYATYQTEREYAELEKTRPLTKNEKAALASFRESLRIQYVGDILRLNLGVLLNPELLKHGSEFLKRNPELGNLQSKAASLTRRRSAGLPSPAIVAKSKITGASHARNKGQPKP